MKRFLVATLMAAFSVSPTFAADVGVSVSIGQPGFYGRIDVGNGYPPPRVIYAEPVVVIERPVAVVQRPIYLRVPPGHAKDWRKHCRRYDACGQRVYFVQDGWYQQEYAPRHRGGDRDRDDDRDYGKRHKHSHKHAGKHQGRDRDD
ncbi:hypothetical protein [Methylibium sp.]|uniref:hypothetical protein n=1 Tax=Methylibium sp. TaxID=2067992 RepID=UPI0017A1EBA1|nr:hypothetical protein [Methylibium sp.]MBA3591029.1 hypothetical protein [Methylibium sp.]